jgi:hypothetical protein
VKGNEVRATANFSGIRMRRKAANKNSGQKNTAHISGIYYPEDD